MYFIFHSFNNVLTYLIAYVYFVENKSKPVKNLEFEKYRAVGESIIEIETSESGNVIKF